MFDGRMEHLHVLVLGVLIKEGRIVLHRRRLPRPHASKLREPSLGMRVHGAETQSPLI